tara:strand:- start:972 stop:1247 length:276 start_codon:yes stop_codon:yes gene_type:complete
MKPVNRMLLVDPVDNDEEAKKPTFYLPDDVATNKEFEVVSMIDVADDSKFADLAHLDIQMVVEGHMLRKVEVDNRTYYLVLENHVLGILEQ